MYKKELIKTEGRQAIELILLYKETRNIKQELIKTDIPVAL